jgi:hypothetical protein
MDADLKTLELDKDAPRRSMQRLVVLLRFSRDDSKKKLLLPHGRLTGAIKPSIGRLAWATQSGNDHSSGIRGERISEGHGQILPQKKKYAMQKINLAKCLHCGHLTHMKAIERNDRNQSEFNNFGRKGIVFRRVVESFEFVTGHGVKRYDLVEVSSYKKSTFQIFEQGNKSSTVLGAKTPAAALQFFMSGPFIKEMVGRSGN